VDAKTFLGSHVALLAGVADEHLTRLAVNSELKSFKAGQTVLFQGVTVDALHVVAVGKVAVFAKVPNKGVVQVAELSGGEVFGETSIFESGTAGASVKAVADGTLVLVIPQDAFKALVAGDPAFVARLQALIAARRGGSTGPAAPGT
jgi:CRP-like cAMP-binding protein